MADNEFCVHQSAHMTQMNELKDLLSAECRLTNSRWPIFGKLYVMIDLNLLLLLKCNIYFLPCLYQTTSKGEMKMAGTRNKIINLAFICISIMVIGSACGTGTNGDNADSGAPAAAASTEPAETPAPETAKPNAAPSADAEPTAGNVFAASPDAERSPDAPAAGQSDRPTAVPEAKPTAKPAEKPSATAKPVWKPKAEAKPASTPTPKPTDNPAVKPTVTPKLSVHPTATPRPSIQPSVFPGSSIPPSAIPGPSNNPAVSPKPTEEPAEEATEKPAPATSVSVAEIAAKLTEELKLGSLKPVEGEQIKDSYGIDADSMLTEYSFNQAMIMMQAGEFSVVKLKSDESFEAVKAGFERRAETVRKSFENYLQDQYEQAKNYQIVRNGLYVLFSISPDQQKAAELFNAFFD